MGAGATAGHRAQGLTAATPPTEDVRPQPLNDGARSNRAIVLVICILAVIVTASALAGLSIREVLAVIPRFVNR